MATSFGNSAVRERRNRCEAYINRSQRGGYPEKVCERDLEFSGAEFLGRPWFSLLVDGAGLVDRCATTSLPTLVTGALPVVGCANCGCHVKVAMKGKPAPPAGSVRRRRTVLILTSRQTSSWSKKYRLSNVTERDRDQGGPNRGRAAFAVIVRRPRTIPSRDCVDTGRRDGCSPHIVLLRRFRSSDAH